MQLVVVLSLIEYHFTNRVQLMALELQCLHWYRLPGVVRLLVRILHLQLHLLVYAVDVVLLRDGRRSPVAVADVEVHITLSGLISIHVL